ncbi:amino acid adenylation domain-containing protein [Nostoc sp. ChiVER01]|uniref:amino acid adenylation domain-containing protein n=1 Tax=Nostoc sp. ChiVER01 TaxID=3075382 RepID=UPI002AD34413|nr:amino acid adenylation domain-containing protein [Nostoc sp. ChiVER01]MDZ8221786.1 amino acid adenylation domain-containing protein [Nostoc sp. ChiVER01]
MKTIHEFLSELRHLDVKLWVEGSNLRYRAAKESLTSDLLAQMRERKAEILEFLLQANSASSNNLPHILPNIRDGKLPLSFAQQRLWILEQFDPGNSVYNIPLAYRLTGSLNVALLEQCLVEIVRRHQILRVTFISIDGQPSQVISPDITLNLPLVDLSQLPIKQREIEDKRLAAQEAQQPFDLVQGPLFRFQLLRLTEKEHVLLLILHHIIADGWSSEVFFQELTALYEAFAAGKSSPLLELSVQYTDFVYWQRQWLQGAVLESQLDYWKQQLSGNLPILELPGDRPRPPVQTYSGEICRQMLPQDLTDALKALSQQSGVTLFMTLLAAFKVLLHRYTGQEDILVGSPIAGRNQVETEGLMGLFVNTLVMRTDLSGNPTFREILDQVRQVALGAYDHQDLPFEKLVEELKPERDRSHSPLFQVMFAMNPPWTKGAEREVADLKIASTFGYTHSGTAKLDLTLVMRDTGKGLRASFEYNTDLFDEATIARMLGHFQTILEGILANPKQRISELPLLTPAERQQLFIEWNKTQTDYPRHACIHQLIEAQVESTPNAVAVVFGNEQLTYRELNSRANQLAHYLRSLGVQTNELVGICLDRSLEMVVGVLGILKAGAAYLPLDPNHPEARVAFMLEDSQAKVLLTQQRLVEFLPKNTAKLVEIDADFQFIIEQNQENLLCGKDTTPKNLAYVIYTSGSTGIPKGVKVPHRSVVNLLTSMRERPGLTQQDILLSVTTLSFDIAVLEIFLPLIVGATTFIVSREVATDGEKLLTTLNHSQATVMQATPATWQLLLAAGWQGSQHLKILCGGEALSTSLAKELVNRTQSVWNMYGPTETTVWSTCYSILKDGIPLIGQPIANTQIYLLDSCLQPVPVGVPGEMYIGGAGVTLGYLNRSELTQERFISNPFSQEPNAQLYRTGDLVRYRADGNLEYLQRMDDQVKIRGFRIELGEVELAIAQYPGVKQAVVIAPEVVPGEKRLVGYVVPNSQQKIAIAELRNLLQIKLPNYMVPSVFVILDTLPLNTNGKVDRKALPVDNLANAEIEKIFATAEDPLQFQLTKIWENVLNIYPIGIKDNFFDLGGHSLLAIRLFSQINKTFGQNLPTAILFQAPTIEQLTNILRQQGCSTRWSSLIPIQLQGSKLPFFYIHSLYGNLFHSRELLGNLDLDQPVYGLQAQGLDRKQAPYTRIEDMAAHYLKEIRTIQPQGPYLLGGWCIGGTVAFEMARQLEIQGEKVELLALFDCYPPQVKSGGNIKRSFVDKLKKRFNHFLINSQDIIKRNTSHIAKLEQKQQLIFFVDRVNHRLQNFIREIVYKLHLKMRLPLPISVLDLAVRDANTQAQRAYIAKDYNGKVTLFWAMERPVEEYYLMEKWKELATGGIEIYKIPGSHDSIMSLPHVLVLSEKLNDCLNNAQRYPLIK